MLIDVSYFTTGPRHIQNATLGTMPNPNAVEVNKAIECYIRHNQETFLLRMLGLTISQKVYGYIQNEQTDNPDINALCDRLRDSFADYVFYQIVKESGTQATITGLVRLKCANDYVSPIRRQVIAWNVMVEKNRIFANWCRSADCHIRGIDVSDAMLTKINSINL